MGRTRIRAAVVASLATATLVGSPLRAQQQVGHKTLGTAGLQAGSQAPVGLYLVDQFVFYHSSVVVDRNGRALPLGLDADLLAESFGASASLELPRIATYVNASVGVPLAYLNASTQTPRLSVTATGLGDLYVQPLKLGSAPRSDRARHGIRVLRPHRLLR